MVSERKSDILPPKKAYVSKIMEKDLTSGSVLKNILFFSLPYMLSFFLQTLYGMADLFIIGQFNATDSITAVSIGSQVMHMITVMIVGLAMGATVTIGLAVGAKEIKKASRLVGNTVTLFVTGSFAVTALLLLLAKPIVAAMSTPSEAIPGTLAYLRICFAGIPFITAYNILSSIFRGLGDAKRPMYFVAVACVCNIVLDYLFIGTLGMGAIGAALGTTVSQTISILTAFLVILKRKTGLVLKKSDFRPQRNVMGGILKIGLPVALQDGFIQIAFLVITIIANRRGLNAAAAVGIVEKVIGVLFLVPSSMLSAVSALAAQNIGAKKHDRAKQTLGCALIISIGFGTVASILIEFIAPQIIGLFEENADVIRLGSQYLRSYVWDCALAGIHFCFSGYFCALGKSGVSFLHNSLSIVLMRIPVSWLTSQRYPNNLFPMGLAAPLGSLLSSVICVIAYLIITKKQKRSET